MKKVVLTLVIGIILSGCGAVDKFSARVSGKPAETCYDGVIYLQFTSGASVKYLQSGNVATCE